MVILNADTIETAAQQYNSCVLEKIPVDRAQDDERILQFLPTSELTASPLSPGTAPASAYRRLRHADLGITPLLLAGPGPVAASTTATKQPPTPQITRSPKNWR
ncbi:hypothetical protein ACFTS5_06310 [Nocardia sp. NPDC056952]|uniref:hypothetical protein n=1 Tax=Nocardia sp. NPDC056952 TaxID=3345979 RepID=UPI0036319FF8